MVAPADGKISSIHQVEFFEPFNGPATCVRIFLSVFDVHINRSPVHGVVTSITHKPGQHLNVLNPESAEVNESNLIIIAHPIRRDAMAAVRQIAGLCARTICCTANTGSVIQRGQRIGIIKLGSTTELYIPNRFTPNISVEQGQYVYAGSTILASIILGPVNEDDAEPIEANQNALEKIEENAQSQIETLAPVAAVATATNEEADTEPQLINENDQASDEQDAVAEEVAAGDDEYVEEPDAEELDETSDEEVEEESQEDDETETESEEDDLEANDDEDTEEIACESDEEIEYEYVEEDEDEDEDETEDDEEVVEEESGSESDVPITKQDSDADDQVKEDDDSDNQPMLF